MFYKGFFKRIIPFFLSFAAGLFIASLFVPLAMPNLRFPSRGSNKHREIQRLNIELNEARRQNSDLKKEIRELKLNSETWPGLIEEVPPVNVDEPFPPPPPRASRAPRHDR